MSAVEDKLRAEIAGYEEERALLGQVIREARAELRKEEARQRRKAPAQPVVLDQTPGRR